VNDDSPSTANALIDQALARCGRWKEIIMRRVLSALVLCAGLGVGACAQDSDLVGPKAVASQPWTLQTIDGSKVADVDRAALTIGPDGNVYGRYGCATIAGRAVFDSERVKFHNLDLAAPDCPERTRAQAQQLVNVLSASDRWSLQDRYLLLFREGSIVPSRLQRQSPASTLLADQLDPSVAAPTQ
jgi:heat shock protein HslJ